MCHRSGIPSLRPAAVICAALMWLCFGAAAANAHADYRGSTPYTDEVLEDMPPEITLRFSEPVDPLTLRWLLPGGESSMAAGTSSGHQLRVTTPKDSPKGTYVLSWRVVSADGHPVAGAVIFSVGEPTTAPVLAASEEAIISPILRGLMVMGLTVSVGGAVFGWLIAPLDRLSRRIAICAAALVPVACLLLVGGVGADRLNLPPDRLLSWQALTAGYAAPTFITAMFATLSAGLAAMALTGRRLAAPIAWLLASLSFALSGHTRSAPGELAPYMTILHAGALLFWLGGLLPLARAMTQQRERLAILQRFSSFAFPIVLVLVASGLGLIWIHLGAPGLFTSNWMILLAVKLTVVGAMLIFALYHRLVLTQRLAAGDARGLVRSIRIEAVLGALVIALAMGFRLAPPPSNAVAKDAEVIQLQRDRAAARLTPSGPPPGLVGFDLAIMDGNMVMMDPGDVIMTMTDAAQGIGPLPIKMRQFDPGKWEAGPVTLPTPGPWTIRLTLQFSEFDKIVLSGDWKPLQQEN